VRIRLSSIVAPAVAAVVLAAPVPDLTGSGGTAGAGTVRGAPGSTPHFHSYTFAGEQVSQTDGPVTMGETIMIPKFDCTKRDEAVYPSMGANVGPTVASSAGVFLGCHRGTEIIYPAFELAGTAKNYPKLTFRAGDQINLQVSINVTQTKLKVVDKTTRTAKTVTGPGASQTINPWAGFGPWYNASNKLEPVPNFGKIASAPSFNGKPLAAIPHLTLYDRYDIHLPDQEEIHAYREHKGLRRIFYEDFRQH